MNKEFTRMQKLAGILTEGYTDAKRADNAHDLGKSGEENLYGAGVEKGEEIEKKKMTKAEAKQAIKDAILAELNYEDPADSPYDEMTDPHNLPGGQFLDEADKDEEEEVEDVEIEDTETVEEPAEDMIDADMEGGMDMDAGSDEAKNAFDELTDAYRSAKELGDEKLIRQLANTITYFNKNIILK